MPATTSRTWGPVHAIPTYHKAGRRRAHRALRDPERPLPLIIDSDPGLDDALAIGLAAASPELRLLAVTTVGGNADVDPLHRERAAAAPRLRPRRRPGRRGRRRGPARVGRPGDGGPRRERHRRPRSCHRPTTRPCPEGAVALIARLLEASPEPGRDRADRAAHQRRAAASALPAPRAADRPPVPDGRLDRGGQHHGLGRVQHHRGPRGGRRRVPVRRADHDDRAGRDPPGAAGPRRRRWRCARRDALGGDRRGAHRATRWPGTWSGPARRPPRSTTRWRSRTSWSRTSSPSPATTSWSTRPTVRRVAGPICDGLPYRLQRDGRTPNADVGIVIDRAAVQPAPDRGVRPPAVAAPHRRRRSARRRVSLPA